MIGPVSTTGRAMMASLQQAMSKGMPPDQAIQYVKSMAQQGIAPLADLYSMMKQFERLKQQKVTPPQNPPTIKDELAMAEQQQRMQQMQQAQAPINQGLGAINAGAMEEPQFAGGGIVAFQEGGGPARSGGTIPYTFNDELATRVPSFMKGDMDIISFVKAQMPNFDTLSMEQKQEVLRQFEPLYMRAREARNTLVGRNAPEVAASAAPATVDMMSAVPALSARSPFATEDEMMQEELRRSAVRPSEAVKPEAEREVVVTGRREAKREPEKDVFSQFERTAKSEADYRQERLTRQKKEKTGEFSEADAELAAYVKEQREQYGASEKEARNNFWIQTGAALMASKSPYFLQALGESVKENYGGLVKNLAELKRDEKALRLQEIQLRRSTEQARETGAREDIERAEADARAVQAMNFNIAGKRFDATQKVLDRASNEAIARARTSGQMDIAADIWRLRNAVKEEKDPAVKTQLQQELDSAINDAGRITEATTAGGLAARARRDIEVAQAIEAVKKDPEYRRAARVASPTSTASPEKKAEAQAEMDAMIMRAQMDPARVLGVTVPSGYGPTIANAAGQNPFAGFSATPIP